MARVCSLLEYSAALTFVLIASVDVVLGHEYAEWNGNVEGDVNANGNGYSIGKRNLRNSSVAARRLVWPKTAPENDPSIPKGECVNADEQRPTPSLTEADGCLELEANSSHLCWDISVPGGYVDVHVTIQNWTGEGWFAWGLSASGGMKGADYVIYTQDSSTGEIMIQDRYSESYSLPTLDEHGDVKLLQSNVTNGALYSVVRRPIRPCDAQDVEFNLLTNSFIWAHGDLRSDGEIIMHTDARRGAFSSVPARKQESHIDPETIVREYPMPDIEINTSESKNLYACMALTVPHELLEAKGHIVYTEAFVDPSSAHLVHHMTLFGCSSGKNVGDGYTNSTPGGPRTQINCPGMNQNCMELVYAWASGAEPLSFSKDAKPALGIPVGKGYPTEFIMQVHYYNPKGEIGMRDSSGVKIGFEVADANAPREDVGTMAVGYLGFELPPGNKRAAVHSVCEGSFIQKDINVLEGIGFHMHSRGVSAKTRLFGPKFDKTWGAPFAERRSYDYSFQSTSPFNDGYGERMRVIEAGTTLVTTCEFDTSKDTTPVKYGEGTQEEMCFGYLHYYPRNPDVFFCGTGDLNGFSGNLAIDTSFNWRVDTNLFKQWWFSWNTYSLDTMTKDLACEASCAWNLGADRWISAAFHRRAYLTLVLITVTILSSCFGN